MKQRRRKLTAVLLSLAMVIIMLPATTISTKAANAVSVTYSTHIQTYGDSQGNKKDGAMAGTVGMSKRLESIRISVSGDSNLGVQYSTHCQTYGWLPWSKNGERNGTVGESKRLEAIKIQLTGSSASKYDIYYRVHAQNYGWLGWAKNGEVSGTYGLSLRLEAIQIVVLPKGSASPALDYVRVNASTTTHTNQTYVTAPQEVMYRTHVQSYGWQDWKINGDVSGTSGKAKRLEGINIQLHNSRYTGGIRYMTHIQTYGWSQGWKYDGQMAGTSGEAKRLEAIKIELTGEMANHYDVYYRVHAQNYGWLAWAKNGAESGTSGLGLRLEAIQIVLVDKGAAAPPSTYKGITQNNSYAMIACSVNGHQWEDITETIHHEAVYERQSVDVCNTCGWVQMPDSEIDMHEHFKNSPLIEVNVGTKENPNFVFIHKCVGSCHSEWRDILVEDEYSETVVTGRRCKVCGREEKY